MSTLLDKLIDKLHNYFKNEFELREVESIKLRYAMEAIINDLSKLLILLAIFALIGKPMELIYSFFTLSMLRPYTGGIHFKTYKGCLAFSVVFFIVAILLAYNITLNNTIVTIVSLLSLLIISLLAPVPAKTRPVYSPRKVCRFRLISGLIVSCHFVLYLLASKNPYIINSIWVIALQCIQILIGKGVSIYDGSVRKIQKAYEHSV